MKTQNLKFIGFSSQYWWLMFSIGVLFICLGAWILATPVQTYESTGLIFAYGLTFSGFFEIIFAFGNHKTLHGWGWTLIGGLIDAALGIYLLRVPMLTLMIMPVVIGLWMLFRGCMAIDSTIRFRAYGVLDWLWLLATGLLIILLSSLLLANQLFGFVNVVVWTGFCFILSGVFRIYLSIQLKY
jgi:uncharacterized membrane protein HdeD (DUF308 family)